MISLMRRITGIVLLLLLSFTLVTASASAVPIYGGREAIQAAQAADKPVMISFFASWSGPSRFIAPLVDELAAQKADNLKIITVDVDEYKMLGAKYHIRSIPTFVLLNKDGEEVGRVRGADLKGLENLLMDF
ncbi:MAG: thioredoxin family protein [Okeania sp. SIO2F4]|uniref:thioredoxin family protein n=1 Tax=Okeania sp. SIO2F4 TaxID=2607790 RepID=UPI001429020A|nr:thioredoxin family protein [Okeania sp. SIO2F4]NES01640.1 thioredoxin family protein [Okeania sp. SIO2F4]